MANSDLCHDGDRNSVHDRLDHPWVTLPDRCQSEEIPGAREVSHHSRNSSVVADICRYTLQCHDCASPSFFSNASLMELSSISSERECRLPYLFGVYNIHDHTTL